MRYYQKCKCCLEDGNLRDMWSEYIYEGQTEIYGNMIIECFSLPWEQPDEENTEHICEVCVDRLRYSLDFRRDIMSAEDIWNELLDQSEADLKMEQLMKQEQQSEEEVNEEDNNSAGNDEDYDDNEGYEILVMEHQTEAGTCKKEEQDSIFGGSQTGDMSADINKDETNAEEYYDSEGGQILVMDNASNTAVSEGTADDEDEQYLDAGSSQDERQESADGEYKPGLEDDMDIEYLEDDSEAEAVLAPKRRRGGKRSYKKYTQDELKQALRAVNEGRMSRSEAAQRYHVPVKTLGAKLRAQDGEGDEAGPPDTASATQTPLNVKHYENIHSILLSSNATPFKGHWGIGFACCFCPAQYKLANELKVHTIQNHDENKANFMKNNTYCSFNVKLDITGLVCTLCEEKMDFLEDLMRHLKKEHDKVLHLDVPNQIVPFKFDSNCFKCAMCDLQFDFFKLLNEHMSCHYRNFKCSLCDRWFINKTSLRMHSYRHRSGEFTCKYCAKVFSTNVRMKDHERVVHRLQSRAHKCGYCEEKFAEAGAKFKHEYAIHGAELKVFNCHACDASFPRQRNLKLHIDTVHLLYKPYNCNDCEQSFRNKSDLVKHKAVHSDVKMFQCGVCLKMFNSDRNLNRHLGRHDVD